MKVRQLVLVSQVLNQLVSLAVLQPLLVLQIVKVLVQVIHHLFHLVSLNLPVKAEANLAVKVPQYQKVLRHLRLNQRVRHLAKAFLSQPLLVKVPVPH